MSRRGRGSWPTSRRERRQRRTLGFVAAFLIGLAGAVAALSTGALGGEPFAPAALASHAHAASSGDAGETRAGLPATPVAGLAAPAPREVRAAAEATAAPGDLQHVARLVADLRDDGIPGNGLTAMERLLAWPPGRLPPLDEALLSFDRQQRHYAAGILRRRCRSGAAVASETLLTVSVEALRSDLAVEVLGTPLHGLAANSLRFLLDHPGRPRAELLRGLDGGDAQQRLLCAFLLACGQEQQYAQRVAFVLSQHLGDNDIAGDALFATHGLYRLGHLARPALFESHRFGDEQARALVELIRRDLDAPPRDLRELRSRRPERHVTNLYHDPAIEFDVGRSVVPTFRSR